MPLVFVFIVFAVFLVGLDSELRYISNRELVQLGLVGFFLFVVAGSFLEGASRGK